MGSSGKICFPFKIHDEYVGRLWEKARLLGETTVLINYLNGLGKKEDVTVISA